ncbi:protein SDA1 homolog isoform X2 [Corticium candelabrum]|uniref:protein SDA1 homolog isoform X2 n=1 Tax=Corticium candelabrum TaxID=121492 RepID=UPI002E3664FE|nr:protein SDA1 homolog isoform X2 [Corticium candelabrum]
MSRRHRNVLPDNLPQLQNLIKRDPQSYEEEFLQQYRHYQAQLQIFQLKPSDNYKSLAEVVTFICQVTQCYPQHLADFPQEIINLLKRHGRLLDPELRMTLCRGLIMIRNKGLVRPIRLFELFFELFRCQDKLLRKTLYLHIVSDVKNINAGHKDNQLNTQLQNFMYTMLRDSSSVAAKMSLDVLTDLYKKNVWHDARTVNVLSTACLSSVTKVMVGAMKFFLGADEEEEESSDSDEDKPTAKELVFKDRVNKKTRKRKRKLDKAMTVLKRHKKKRKRSDTSSFSALHLLYDPQDFAEKLFKHLEKSKERFEVKLMMLNLISRLIGVHKLFLFNFYPFIQRFLQPHQREVTKLLMYSAQACHDLVPSEVAEPALMAVVNNFITERNSSEVMAVGLNAVREMCGRCPLIMKEDLLRDLAQYKSHRSKNVVMAARSLIQLYRDIHPDLLHKKDRGRPTEAAVGRKPLQYGEVAATSFVPGTELLTKKDMKHDETNEVHISDDDELAQSDEEWQSISDSGDEIILNDDTSDEADNNEEEDIQTDSEDTKNEQEDKDETETETIVEPTQHVAAEEISQMRMILKFWDITF